jgi:hypothetical protein
MRTLIRLARVSPERGSRSWQAWRNGLRPRDRGRRALPFARACNGRLPAAREVRRLTGGRSTLR